MNRLELRTFNYLNPSSGKILIVGEKPNPNKDWKPERVPFCSNGHCSGWLNKKLDDCNIDENKLQWLNAFDDYGVETSREELLKRLPAIKVIALGNVASKWLDKNDVEHVKIPHPQYWKRFKSKEEYPLIYVF